MTMSPTSVKIILEDYIHCFPNEVSRLKIFFSQIKEGATSEIFSRKNIPGHITANAFVLNEDFTKILLIRHKFLGKCIQPGGHIDSEDVSIIAAALRELKEEVGISEVSPIAVMKNPEVPFDIGIHAIPLNPKKMEEAHDHYDFMYLFYLTNHNNLQEQVEEIDGAEWVPFEQFSKMSEFVDISKKIVTLLKENRDSIFFEMISKNFFKKKDDTQIEFIIVTHIVKDITAFLEALSRVGHIRAIIPKKKSIEIDVLKKLESDGYPIHNIGRDELRDPEFLKNLFVFNGPYVIFDIGGYFAQKDLYQNIGEKIIGIVEDTENGYLKYKSVIQEGNFPYPVVSLARSSLKENEDDLVGYSIGFYTEIILRSYRILPRYATVGVIGYGKIGRGIVSYLLKQNSKPLLFDTNPIQMVRAYKDGCIPVKRENIFQESDIIFCATGNKSITMDDFDILKTGCFIASATSSDDEFGFSTQLKNSSSYTFSRMKNNIQKVVGKNNFFFLINEGNAVNFIIPGDRVGDMIRLVQAEHIAACASLIYNFFPPSKISEVREEDRKHIAYIFLEKLCNKSFSGTPRQLSHSYQ